VSHLTISLFGSLTIETTDWSAQPKLPRTALALLAYLVLQPRESHSREVLADLFWRDVSAQKARHALNTALWRLRNAIEPPGTLRANYVITTGTGEIGFNRHSDYWLDVAEFERQSKQAMSVPVQAMTVADIQKLQVAVQLYRGDLMDGFYDDWIIIERERLRNLYLTGLARLMEACQHHHLYEDSIAYGQQILKHDSLREEIHRGIMRLYLDIGQPAMAVRQYLICRAVLARDLHIEPMEATQALYAQIISTAHTTSEPAKSAPLQGTGNSSVEELQHQLQLALRRLEAVEAQLRQMDRLLTPRPDFPLRPPLPNAEEHP
jgi:DNA-binding SARP family transcriptional activator